MAVDGVPGAFYDWVLGPPAFSPDSKHTGYVAGTVNGDKIEWRVVVDGSPGPPYDRIVNCRPGTLILFGPDNRRVAYAAVNGKAPPGPRSGQTGTAFGVGSDGYLLTCAHVVQDAAIVTVTFGNKKHNAAIVAQDRALDLALLKINVKDLPVLPLGNSAEVETGIDVRAVGFPLASLLGENLTASRGTVSGSVVRNGRKLYQVDAPINPGNSGGPLVNESGEVSGVINAKLVGRLVSNIGFARPIDQARDMLRNHHIKPAGKAAKAPGSGAALVKQVRPAVALVSVIPRATLLATMPIGNPFVVIDGTAGKPSDPGIPLDPTFSRDGRFAYVVTHCGPPWFPQRVVIDGKEDPEVDRITGVTSFDPLGKVSYSPLQFSPDGKHLAYVAGSRRVPRTAAEVTEVSKLRIILDGKPQTPYHNPINLTFSPDGSRLAYKAQKNIGQNWLAVIDGKESREYQNLGRIIFSPDGRRVAFFGSRDNKQFLIVDGVEHETYLPAPASEPPIPVFSPDSKRLAYRVYFRGAKKGSSPPIPWRPGMSQYRWRVVVDGREEKDYAYVPSVAGSLDDVPAGTPVFSPDSKHVAYALGDQEFTVIRDGVPGKNYQRIAALTFSPDSQHLAYLAFRRKERRFEFLVVRDGVEQKSYENFSIRDPGFGLFFSPDSQHLAYTPSDRALQNYRIVVDDQESKSYGGTPLLPLLFDGPNTLHTLAGGRLVEIRIDGGK